MKDAAITNTKIEISNSVSRGYGWCFFFSDIEASLLDPQLGTGWLSFQDR